MRFLDTGLAGAVIVEPDLLEDERGFFARVWSRDEFERRGLNAAVAQCNISHNRRSGTLRGMHYQVAPYEEAKLVRCTAGAIYDVIIDLRRDSQTFTRHFGIELTSENRRLLYVPEGFAHGFVTLQDDTEVFYQMSQFYAPDHARGVRWDDPAFGIQWPVPVEVMSERDRTYPDFSLRLLEAPGSVD